MRACATCDGSGTVGARCSACGGHGLVGIVSREMSIDAYGDDRAEGMEERCQPCGGGGTIPDQCPACGGSGTVGDA